MTRLCVILLAFALILSLASGLQGAGSKKTPLDLPSGGAGKGDEEEDAPEVIDFYGGSFEGDAFFWLLDRSLSMEGLPFTVLKQEVTESLRQLTNRAEFAIIAFDNSFATFPSQQRPIRATRAHKAQANEWVNSITLGVWTCMAEPAGKIIEIANLSKKRKRVILMVGDGIPLCDGFNNNTSEEVHTTIDSTNVERIKINTIFISHEDDDSEGAAFFREIANKHRGKFINVEL